MFSAGSCTGSGELGRAPWGSHRTSPDTAPSPQVLPFPVKRRKQRVEGNSSETQSASWEHGSRRPVSQRGGGVAPQKLHAPPGGPAGTDWPASRGAGLNSTFQTSSQLCPCGLEILKRVYTAHTPEVLKNTAARIPPPEAVNAGCSRG